jgi:hypothetical protein
MGKQCCQDLGGQQITPKSPVFTEEARRQKPQWLKILNIRNINKNIFNLIKNLSTELQAYVL